MQSLRAELPYAPPGVGVLLLAVFLLGAGLVLSLPGPESSRVTAIEACYLGQLPQVAPVSPACPDGMPGGVGAPLRATHTTLAAC